jgi:hypothetical protein
LPAAAWAGPRREREGEKEGRASGPRTRERGESASGPKWRKEVGREKNFFSFSKSSFPIHFQTEF